MRRSSVLIIILLIVLIAWFGFSYNKKSTAINRSNITYTNSSTDLIVVDSPLPNSTVSKKFLITGKARGTWYFEASFPVQVLDKNGNVIAQTPAQAQSDWMTTEFVPFKADMTLPNSFSGSATLILKKDNPSGLPQNDASISFPVNINNSTKLYKDTSRKFSIHYPSDFIIDNNYSYQLNPDKNINGVKFTIPSSYTTGTNLGSDSYISVENILQTRSCVVDLFFDQKVISSKITDMDTTYSVASSTGAGAGNRYEETIYVISGSNPCIAVRYFIHYGVIENYPEGTVKEFDKQKLLKEFDDIRRTLVITR